MSNGKLDLTDFSDTQDGEEAVEELRFATRDVGRPPQDIRELEPISDVPITLSAVLGEVMMPVGDLLRLTRGSTIALNRKVGEPIDIHLNTRLVARGEVVMVEDRLGINMTEIIKKEY